MDYYNLLHQVLCKYFIKNVLEIIRDEGLDAHQCVYIAFNYSHHGVVVPAMVSPDISGRVAICFQFGFWNLEVFDSFFQVDLKFNGQKEKVKVPFDSITDFIDTGHKFKLMFSPQEVEYNFDDEDEEDNIKFDGNIIQVDFNNYEEK